MKQRAVELGVPSDVILIEHTALTTRENALFSGEILRRQQLLRALIVTQPYHRRRAVAAFRRVGIQAKALKFRSQRDTLRQHGREVVARWVYRLRGWI